MHDNDHLREVFGVPPGGELSEAHGRTYRGSPAVNALVDVLDGFPEFRGKGRGPSGFWNEYNRHHAGLAVDVMVNPENEPQVALWQNLYRLFITHRGIMRWRGMIFQHAGVSFGGGATGPIRGYRYAEADHMKHIHIDWHDSSNVTWHSPNTSIPFRRRDGSLINLTPKQGNRIAATISWTVQAESEFRTNTTLRTAITDLLNNHRAGGLSSIDLEQEVGLTP